MGCQGGAWVRWAGSVTPERDCGRRREVYNVAEAGWRSIDHLAAATTFISISCRASTYILPQMPCRVDASYVRVILLALLALAACIAPASTQIHWNRGWGAGGSMGKRSSASSPMSPSASLGVDTEAMMLSSECSFDVAHVSNLLARIIESEASRLAGCEVRGRYPGLSPVMGGDQDSLGRLPWWYASRKSSNEQ
ncbi:uncharacterized protein LOC125039981 [Penaeus chinensis]|uniref:uncharacterized protein LOC125039981 n=1 Tax=Penaeus chinensis TaxID=139456 RepID=UPI001FB7DAAB|nr:uncharacterized protein LOC125039981 [Penaeus chinensis]